MADKKQPETTPQKKCAIQWEHERDSDRAGKTSYQFSEEEARRRVDHMRQKDMREGNTDYSVSYDCTEPEPPGPAISSLSVKGKRPQVG